MKKLNLTPEQICHLINGYYIKLDEGEMYSITDEGNKSELTRHNFRAYVFYEGEFYVLTVDDFEYRNPAFKSKDFQIKELCDYVFRSDTPDEVVALLDQVINERNTIT